MLDHHRFPIEARPQIRALSSSMIREVANAGMGKADILPFWFGESDQPTAGYIRDAAAQSLALGETFYAQNMGRPYLREAIAAYMSDLHGRSVTPDRVGVVASGVTGLMVAAQLLLSPGDRVVAVTPLWPNVTEIPNILGANVERIGLTVRGGRWDLDLDRLLAALTPQTRMLILNSPNNPTGWTITHEQISEILARCRRLGIWILSDEVYERLIYDPVLRSAPTFQHVCEPEDRVISINSFSKAWSMTGWRAGWIASPAALEPELTKLIEYNFSCVFEPTQRAAVAALKHGEPEVTKLRTHLARTRAVLSEALKGLDGIEVPEAGGAMYVFFRIVSQPDSLSAAKCLVSDVGLGLAPGPAFGPEGRGWLRWCHAVADEGKLLAGVDRLATFLCASR